jgi:two-component sensor histidine kinase
MRYLVMADTAVPHWPLSESEMSARIRAFDWSRTPLGAVEAWPHSLRTAVQLMLDSGCPCSIHAGAQAVLLYNDAHAPILGDLHPDALGRPLFEAVPTIRRKWEPVLRRVMAGANMMLGGQRHRITSHGVQQEIWLDHAASPIRDETGAVAGLWCMSFDITHRKQARTRQPAAKAALREKTARKAYLLELSDALALQERQKVLVAELQHRTRNLMAVVRSIGEQTVKGSANLTDFGPKFRDRMDALARVQGLLSRLSEGERITFDELIREELSALGALDGQAGRVTLEGPGGVALRSSMLQTFAMALHELVTNAAKYGALHQPQGRLSVRWRLETGEDGLPWLQVEWRESGVVMPAPDAAPTGGGQGRELIEHALPYQLGAKTSFVMAPDGVHCLIALPVSRRHAIEDPNDDRRLSA